MKKGPQKFRRSLQSGFTLLEILITMVIIAIGMMGFAAMMMNSMKNNRTAMQRSLATFYAYDILDCMRVNRAAAAAYQRNFADSIPSASGSLAQQDLNLWLTGLSTALPSGQAKIGVVGDTATIEIQWAENINAGDSGSHQWKTVSTL